MKAVNFHKTSLLNPEFFKLDLTHDWLEQTVPGGVLQIQPELGSELQNEFRIRTKTEFS